MDLASKKCVACEGGIAPFSQTEIELYKKETPLWGVSSDNKKISRQFSFADFVSAIQFVNKVAELAEAEGHHPDIIINYNKVTLELWTHAIGGLSENDFILAVKIDRLAEQQKRG